MRRFLLSLLVLGGLVVFPTPAQAASCTYHLGFQAIYQQIPNAVGTCLDNEAYAENGDSVQHTTGGLLAWRRGDNWTAFTNGYQTWVNGPHGLQVRFNDERFPWENDGQLLAST